MLKTTMLVAGLAAATALDKKECSGSSTLTNDDLGTAFVCTAAKTDGAFCTYTAKTTATHFGGGVKCVEDKLAGSAAGSGCFEYQVVKSCPLLTKAVVEGWGCTQAAEITATDISVDSTTKAAKYSCTIADTHAKYTEDADGVKTYNADATVTVNCDHAKGTWPAPMLSTEGVCSAPVLSDGDVANNYRLSDTTTTDRDLRGANMNDRDVATEVADFLLYSDGNPNGAKNCGLASGKAKAAADFPKVIKGEYCATEHQRDGSTDSVPHFGAFKCNGGANWELPKKMCEVPRRCYTIDDAADGCPTAGGTNTVGQDTYYANKLVGSATTNPTGGTPGFEATVFCGTKTEIAAATTSSAPAQLDLFGISNLATGTLAKNYIPPTSADYRCFFETATQTDDYGYAEVTCSGGTAITAANLPTAKKLCPTGVLTSTDDTSGNINLKFTGVKVDAGNTYATSSVTRKILERSNGGDEFKIPGDKMNTVQSTADGQMVKADGTTRKILTGCKCGTDATYTCSTIETGCKKGTAALSTTLEGRAVKCTIAEQAATDLGGTQNCAASGNTLSSVIECKASGFAAKSGGGTKCLANATVTAQKSSTETSRGFSWSCAAQTTAGQCSSNVVPTDGRTTCAKARWAPGYLTCSLVDGKWSIQDDYSKCAGSMGYELSAADREAHNFESYSIGSLPGSLATVVCKTGFGELKVKNAAGVDTMIQKGSGTCSKDNLGTTKFVPCLKSCNTSNVATDLNGTAEGTLDVAGTDCAGLKVWNNNSENYQYDCNTKSADKYNGGRVYCDGKTGKFAVGEKGTLKKCSIPAELAKGQVGALCAAGGATDKGTSYLDVACTALGLVAVDGKEVDKESAVYKMAYDCTGVTADGAKCTVSTNETNYDVAATCCTTNACLDDAKCYQPGKDTRDRTEGCWNFKVDPKESGASMIGAGIVTLLALFHL